MTSDQLIVLIRKTVDRVTAAMTDPTKLTDLATIQKSLSVAKKELAKLLALGNVIGKSLGLDQVYKQTYKDLSKILSLDNVSQSQMQKKANVRTASVQKEADKMILNMVKMAEFNLKERAKMQSAVVETYSEAEKRRKIIQNQKGDVNQTEIDRIAKDIRDRFAPQSGVRKFRNQYYGLDGKPARKEWENNWFEVSEQISGRMAAGFKGGETLQQTQKRVLEVLDKAYPSGSFPIAVEDRETGEIGIRELGIKYYAEMKIRYWDSTAQTATTTEVMLDAGFDLVRYALHGSQDHSPICLEMSAGGVDGIYSLSGKSPNYPQLTVFPPAHYNCQSTIDPLPSEQQERIQVDQAEQEAIQEQAVEPPQAKTKT